MAKSVRLITCQAGLYLGYSLQNAYIIYGAQRRQISKIQGRSSGAGEIVGNAAVIAVIGAFIALGVLGVLFYVSTLAKNVYQIKIQMKDDLAYELDRLKDHVEKEMLQRQKWITRDVASVSDAKFDLVDGPAAGHGGEAEPAGGRFRRTGSGLRLRGGQRGAQGRTIRHVRHPAGIPRSRRTSRHRRLA